MLAFSIGICVATGEFHLVRVRFRVRNKAQATFVVFITFYPV